MHLTTVALQVLWSIMQKLIMWIVISRSILEHSTSIFHEELFVYNVSLYKANKSFASTISKLFPLINSAVILSLIKNADSRWREFIMHASMQKIVSALLPVLYANVSFFVLDDIDESLSFERCTMKAGDEINCSQITTAASTRFSSLIVENELNLNGK